jgi:hypothetical protein
MLLVILNYIWINGGLVVSFNNYYSKTRLVATLYDYVKSNWKTILFVYLWLFEMTVCKLWGGGGGSGRFCKNVKIFLTCDFAKKGIFDSDLTQKNILCTF